MKKYVKPELFFEQFELSQHIADCALEFVDPSGIQTSGNPDSCIAYPDDEYLSFMPTIVFTGSNSECIAAQGEFNEYCYTGSTSGMNTFMS